MKIITLNQSSHQTRPGGKRMLLAFTLIEMIGVLAVIAILAALLLPKVFNAINEARVNGTAVSINSLKTAVTDHYGKYNALNISNTTSLTVPVNPYDQVLMGEGLMDKPFAARIGTSSAVQLVSGVNGNAGSGYNLGQGGTTTNQAFTAEIVITNVTAQDAVDLGNEIDGQTTNSLTAAKTSGRVQYTAPAAGLVPTVYVYLTGR